MAKNYINIAFPFQSSDNGFFLKMNDTSADAIKSDLMFLLLTPSGSRYYNPEFGCNLLKFIFEPNDGLTFSQIEDEISTAVKRYLPKLTINKVDIVESTENGHLATVTIKYTLTDDVFTAQDILTINI